MSNTATAKLAGSVEVTGGNDKTAVTFGGGPFGENADAVTIGKNTLGKSLVVTSAGPLSYTFVTLRGDAATLAGSVEATGGTLDSQLVLSEHVKISLGMDKTGQSLTMTSGAGNDALNLLSPSLSVAGRIDFTGGDGLDSAKIQGDGTIRGDVTLDLGLGSSPSITLFEEVVISTLRKGGSGLKLAGSLSVHSTSTDAWNYLTLKGLDLAKAVTIVLGDGSDIAVLDNLLARTSLALTTGASADFVAIELPTNHE